MASSMAEQCSNHLSARSEKDEHACPSAASNLVGRAKDRDFFVVPALSGLIACQVMDFGAAAAFAAMVSRWCLLSRTNDVSSDDRLRNSNLP